MKAIAYRLYTGLFGLAAFWALGLLSAKELGKSGVLMAACMVGVVGFVTITARRRHWLSSLSNTVFLVFFLDAAVKGFLRTYFGLRPNHSMVLQAVFDTNPGEASEFFVQNWRAVGQVGAIFLLIALFAIGAERYLARRERGMPLPLAGRTVKFSVNAMLVFFVALHFNPTMAKENPLLFWPLRYATYQAQLAEVKSMQQARQQNMARQADWKVEYHGGQQRTVVWVIGESINRTNMSLYGYQRRTTPLLDQMRKELVVFNDVISSDASTLPSMMKMLTPATVSQPDEWRSKPDVLALAAAAGYKTFWISNQTINDGWIGLIAGQADERTFINQGSGRGENNFDGNLLPHFERALADNAPRKLIVVHLLGAHPTYKSRYPTEFARFDGITDEVAAMLNRQGRQFWVRWQRDEYDNAILYNDHVVSGLIRKISQHPAGDAATLIYAADHGQEVGHNRDHAGHSPIDKSGYEIPLIVWDKSLAGSGADTRAGLENRPYQADQLEHTVLGLLEINSVYYDARHDILGNEFRPGVRSINGEPYLSRSEHLALTQLGAHSAKTP